MNLNPKALPPIAPVVALPPIIDATKCAELLCCTRAWVCHLADKGLLPGLKHGRTWTFNTAQLLAWFATKAETEAAARRARAVETMASPIQTRITLTVPRARGRRRRELPAFAKEALAKAETRPAPSL
jgi:phage terminase Nu1 subunit (DNA packaging protein)